MKQTTRYLSYILIVVFVSALALGTGYHYGRIEAKSLQIPITIINGDTPANASSTNFALFWKVWNILDEKFATTKSDKVTDTDKLYGAIKGLAESYGDPYTAFFPPAEATEFDTEIEGSFEGVGMEVSMKEGVLTVVAPLKGSPSEKAGVRAGDKILKIDSTVTSGLSVDKAIKLIRGKRGTVVTLLVLHPDSRTPVEIAVTREVINVPTIEAKQLPTGPYLIRLYSFSAQSAFLFRDAVQTFARTGNKKLILDLRGNPGGYLDAAVDIASWFLPGGNTVVTEEFKNGAESVYHRSKGYNTIGSDYKIVILVDGGSASASEILAGALQEYGKATLVGTDTFGKGSVQEYMKVSEDTALKVTVARWLTPKGVSISEGGLKPDVEVKMTQEDVDKGRDPQLDKAVNLLTK